MDLKNRSIHENEDIDVCVKKIEKLLGESYFFKMPNGSSLYVTTRSMLNINAKILIDGLRDEFTRK